MTHVRTSASACAFITACAARLHPKRPASTQPMPFMRSGSPRGPQPLKHRSPHSPSLCSPLPGLHPKVLQLRLRLQPLHQLALAQPEVWGSAHKPQGDLPAVIATVCMQEQAAVGARPRHPTLNIPAGFRQHADLVEAAMPRAKHLCAPSELDAAMRAGLVLGRQACVVFVQGCGAVDCIGPRR